MWHFSTNKSIEKIDNIHKCYLKLILNDYNSDYKTLLDKSDKEYMKIRRIKTFAIEIFKTVNELNPNFMKTVIASRTNFRVRPLDLIEFDGSKSLMVLKTKRMECSTWKCKNTNIL